MEHTIIFSDEISEESVQGLIDEISKYEFVNLYFCTDGGCIFSMRILVDFLNYRNSLGSLKLILNRRIASAGTYLLTDYEGDLYVRDLYYIIFHAADVNLPKVRRYDHQNSFEKSIEDFNEEYFSKFLLLGLTKADISKMRGGKDIFISRENFNKLKVEFIVKDYYSRTKIVA